MVSKEEKSVQVTARISDSKYDSLKKYAAGNHINIATAIRRFVDKGLAVHSYEDNIDMIAEILRQEIRNENKAMVNRIAGLLYKMGKTSSSTAYLNAALLSNVNPDPFFNIETVLKRADRLGAEFMAKEGTVLYDSKEEFRMKLKQLTSDEGGENN